ncbi:type IV pilus modification PilV family protein [Vibrio maerlii]|uniref:type IV pilus modification PilV family protein n=1 Tax=Vibrio maerlii TaxID=2231648 RepID=UPI000E3C96AA|nr:type II secretion system protein [Vibrio maerlii]
MIRGKGFTLIESIIVIVVMGLAMVTITSFLVPQVSRSADPHYQARASALGQSVMSLILARSFDENSDRSGGELRCGEVTAEPCSTTLGDNGEASVDLYNDVDDYKGCWEPNSANNCKDLNALVGEAGTTTYRNFRLDIDVTYETVDQLKRIDLTVSASNQTPINLSAYRGNY